MRRNGSHEHSAASNGPPSRSLLLTGIWNVGVATKGEPHSWKVVLGVKIGVVLLAGLGAFLHQRSKVPSRSRHLGCGHRPGVPGRPCPRRPPGRLTNAAPEPATAASTNAAKAQSIASLPGAPTNCSPAGGRLRSATGTGTEMAGKPARFTGAVNT